MKQPYKLLRFHKRFVSKLKHMYLKALNQTKFSNNMNTKKNCTKQKILIVTWIKDTIDPCTYTYYNTPRAFSLGVIKQGGGVYLCIKRRTLCDRDYRLNIKRTIYQLCSATSRLTIGFDVKRVVYTASAMRFSSSMQMKEKITFPI